MRTVLYSMKAKTDTGTVLIYWKVTNRQAVVTGWLMHLNFRDLKVIKCPPLEQ